MTLGAAPLPCADTRSSAFCTGIARLYVGTLALISLRDHGILCSPASVLVTHCAPQFGGGGTVNCGLLQQIIVASLDDANTTCSDAFYQRVHF